MALVPFGVALGLGRVEQRALRMAEVGRHRFLSPADRGPKQERADRYADEKRHEQVEALGTVASRRGAEARGAGRAPAPRSWRRRGSQGSTR